MDFSEAGRHTKRTLEPNTEDVAFLRVSPSTDCRRLESHIFLYRFVL